MSVNTVLFSHSRVVFRGSIIRLQMPGPLKDILQAVLKSAVSRERRLLQILPCVSQPAPVTVSNLHPAKQLPDFALFPDPNFKPVLVTVASQSRHSVDLIQLLVGFVQPGFHTLAFQ
jgi:hypothetical protein